MPCVIIAFLDSSFLILDKFLIIKTNNIQIRLQCFYDPSYISDWQKINFNRLSPRTQINFELAIAKDKTFNYTAFPLQLRGLECHS